MRKLNKSIDIFPCPLKRKVHIWELLFHILRWPLMLCLLKLVGDTDTHTLFWVTASISHNYLYHLCVVAFGCSFQAVWVVNWPLIGSLCFLAVNLQHPQKGRGLPIHLCPHGMFIFSLLELSINSGTITCDSKCNPSSSLEVFHSAKKSYRKFHLSLLFFVYSCIWHQWFLVYFQQQREEIQCNLIAVRYNHRKLLSPQAVLKHRIMGEEKKIPCFFYKAVSNMRLAGSGFCVVKLSATCVSVVHPAFTAAQRSGITSLCVCTLQKQTLNQFKVDSI